MRIKLYDLVRYNVSVRTIASSVSLILPAVTAYIHYHTSHTIIRTRLYLLVFVIVRFLYL